MVTKIGPDWKERRSLLDSKLVKTKIEKHRFRLSRKLIYEEEGAELISWVYSGEENETKLGWIVVLAVIAGVVTQRFSVSELFLVSGGWVWVWLSV